MQWRWEPGMNVALLWSRVKLVIPDGEWLQLKHFDCSDLLKRFDWTGRIQNVLKRTIIFLNINYELYTRIQSIRFKLKLFLITLSS